jgi:hypothetical protein
MRINETIKRKLRNWLEMDKGMNPLSIRIIETMDFEANCFKNSIWYRGDPSELHQFYTQFDDMMGNTRFWQAVATNGVNFRKIHTGLPALIIDTLADITFDDMNTIEFNNLEAQELWEAIEKKLPEDFFKDSFKEAMYMGDGAVRFTYDSKISKYPIPEFFPADMVDFKRDRGYLKAIIFKIPFVFKEREYLLKEIHTNHSIDYELWNPEGEKENILDFPELADVKPLIHDAEFWTAVPIIVGKSPKYKGRGKSLFDGKEDAFDSFDEAYSQWIEALRDNRTKTFIPEQMIPKDPKNGLLLKPSPFDGRFIKIKGLTGTEGASPNIDVEQGEIDDEGLLASYNTALDQCLQGLISPSTLGIDVKKLDNAEAQREKEKATISTRNKIVRVAEKVIPQIIEAALHIMDMVGYKPYREYEITISFGEYANPSFESVVETVGKAKQYGVMSNETVVDEMYGDSKDDDWKEKEVARLNAIDGLNSKEPSINEFDDLGGVVPTEEDYE